MAAPEGDRGARPWWLGVAVVLVGAVWLHAASGLALHGGYAVVGPGVVPLIVGAVLVLLGGLLLVQIARGERFEPQEAEDAEAGAPASLPALGLAVAGAGLPLLTIGWLGFPLTAAAMFTLVTLAFGERRVPRSLAIGLVLSSLSWYGFSLLGVDLGPYLPLLVR